MCVFVSPTVQLWCVDKKRERIPFFSLTFSLLSTNIMLTQRSWVKKNTGMERRSNGDHMSAAGEQSSHSTLMFYIAHIHAHISISVQRGTNERKCQVMTILYIVDSQLWETTVANLCF